MGKQKIVTKQKIITNTVIFIFVMAFILAFKAVFGTENTLIGVSTITATLMLLGRDFTGQPLKNTLMFLGINLLMGVGTAIADMNIWIAIPINFIVVFSFSYIFTYNLREPLYFPFGLQYVFLLSSPVTGQKLVIRLLALIFGALVIMLVQMLVNRNKLSTAGNKLLAGVCESIENKVKDIKDGSGKVNYLEKVNSSIDDFRTIVYDKRDTKYYSTEEAKIKLNMSVALESINSELYRDNIKSVDRKIIGTLYEIVNSAKAILSFNPKKDKKRSSKSYDIDKLLNYCQQKEVNDLLTLQLLESMIFLDETIIGLNKLDKNEYKKIDKTSHKSITLPNDTVKDTIKGTNSPKYCYAMRLSIAITVGAFIMDFFKLAEGRWILFSILSLTTPLYETYRSKVGYRLISNIIGGIIILILFSIVKGETPRLLIVMITGYLMSYATEYKYRMIFVTICAIGSAAVVGNIQEFTAERIIMVLIGTIIAIISNRYLFPYSLKNSNAQLRKMYHASVKEMFEEIDQLLDGNVRPEIIQNLFIVTALIESKSRVNKQIDDDKNYKEIVNERRRLVSNIYELYRWLSKEKLNANDKERIHKDVKSLIQYQNEDISSKISIIENSIVKCESIYTKITLGTITTILKELKRLNELNTLREKAQV